MPKIVKSTGCGQHILDRGTFERRTASDVEKSVAVLKGPFAVALGDVQRDRLGGTEPLVTGVAMDAGKRFGVGELGRNIVDGETVNIESVVVEDGLGHGSVVSSRSTSIGLRPEYEYDSMPERLR